MASCGYCGAARKAMYEAARALARGDLAKSSEQVKITIENVKAKARSESDRIRSIRGVK